MKSQPALPVWTSVTLVAIGLFMTLCVFLLFLSDESPDMAGYDTYEQYEQAREAYDTRTAVYATVATVGVVMAILGGMPVQLRKWLVKRPIERNSDQIPVGTYAWIIAIMFALSAVSWFLAQETFGVCVVLCSIVIAICCIRFPERLSQSLKVPTILVGFAAVTAMLFIEPLWMGSLALSTAIVLAALIAKEPRQASMRKRAAVVTGILLFDAFLILIYHPLLWSLTVVMPFASLLILLALIAYPRSYPSMPADRWQ